MPPPHAPAAVPDLLDPIAEFQSLFARLSQDAPTDPTAMALATADDFNKKSAEQMASERALVALGLLSEEDIEEHHED